MHINDDIDEGTDKPEMVMNYNKTEGGLVAVPAVTSRPF